MLDVKLLDQFLGKKLKPILTIQEEGTSTSEGTICVLTDTNMDLGHSNINDGQFEQVNNQINCIRRISNLKTSTDFDSKKIKINRLRVDLYNYYDARYSLSSVINEFRKDIDYGDNNANPHTLNETLVGKKVRLFYATPGANSIIPHYDADDQEQEWIRPPTASFNSHEPWAVLKMFTGTISRVVTNKESISLTIEDSTQIKLASKLIPYAGFENLEVEIRNNITENYKEEDNTIPMTFGKVDRAFVLPYIEPNQPRVMNFLLDTQATSGHFKTSKIPFYHDYTLNGDYQLYIKEENEYIIFDSANFSTNLQNQNFSKILVYSIKGSTAEYVVPELAELNSQHLFAVWDAIGILQRNVESVYASDGSLLDLYDIEVPELDYDSFENLNALNNNGNNPKIWYRAGENTAKSVNFDTGVKTWNNNYNEFGGQPEGSGRWILLKLDKGVGAELVSQFHQGEWIGNTFLNIDYQLRANNNLVSTNSFDWKWFCTPISVDVLKDSYDYINENGLTYPEREHFIFAALHMGTEDRYQDLIGTIEAPHDADNWNNVNYYGSIFPRTHALQLDAGSAKSEGSKYWAPNSSTSTGLGNNDPRIAIPIRGLGYGESGEYQLINGPADQHEFIALHEYKLNIQGIDSGTASAGLKVNNVGFSQYVKIEDIREKDIFASIEGRKNYFFTEQLDQDTFELPENTYTDFELQDYTHGLNGNLPDFETLIKEFMKMMYACYNRVVWHDAPDEEQSMWDAGAFGIEWGASYSETFLNDPQGRAQLIRSLFQNDTYDSYLSTFYNDFINVDDAPFVMTFSFFKNFVVKFIIRTLKIADFCELFTRNIAEAEERMANGDNMNYWNWYGGDFRNADNFFVPTLSAYRQAYNFASAEYDQHFGGYIKWNTLSTKLATELFSYLYQTQISPHVALEEEGPGSDEDWSIDSLQIVNEAQTNVDDAYIFVASLMGNVNFGGPSWAEGPKHFTVPVNLTSSVQQYRQYSWDSFGIQTPDELIENLYVYYDDLFYAVNRSIYENLAQIKGASQVGFSTFEWVYNENFNPPPDFDTIAPEDVKSFSSEEGVNTFIDIEYQNMQVYLEANYEHEDVTLPITTDGKIVKPSDIAMNILVNEMGFGVYDQGKQIGRQTLLPDYTKFNMDSIDESREIHANWKMGFSINKKTKGKEFIEDLLSESQSYPKFDQNGLFSLINIKNNYEYEDVNKRLNSNDIQDYSFELTKIEDVVTSIKLNYNYDNGLKQYTKSIFTKITDLLPDYGPQGFATYNIEPIDGYREMNLKYHTDKETVKKFAEFYLLNHCNQHLIANLTLGVENINLEIGDLISIPLINNEKFYSRNYSRVENVNGQNVFPIFIIMETNIGLDNIKVKAVQLHQLKKANAPGATPIHQYILPGEVVPRIICNQTTTNTNYSFTTDTPVLNRNATTEYGEAYPEPMSVQIPYFDLNCDGIVDYKDYEKIVLYATGQISLTLQEREALKHNADGVNMYGANIEELLPERLDDETRAVELITAITDFMIHNNIEIPGAESD